MVVRTVSLHFSSMGLEYGVKGFSFSYFGLYFEYFLLWRCLMILYEWSVFGLFGFIMIWYGQ